MQPVTPPFNPYPQTGEVLDGKYRIERLLGEGGMGAVAKATHLLRRAPVALKFMSGAIMSFPGAVERFVNEGVAASQIDSDHVVKVFDVGRLPSGAPYLVMEFLDGRDLGDLIAAEGPRLPVARAVHFTLQMLRALQTAHQAGIVHRDMKPSNCFIIEKDGEPDFVKLVDFGISKVRTDDGGQSANLTRTNSALGTPLYMSPEQARSPRDVDHRSDLYSVGAIIYEMLGGRTPYTSETGEYTEILFKIFTTEPESLLTTSPDVPEGLAAVVHHALQRDREARFADAAEMAEALLPFADGRSAALIAKFRSRGRSMIPGAMPEPSVAPGPMVASSPGSPIHSTAAAFASVPPAPRGASVVVVSGPGGQSIVRPATVPTDIGVARDAAPPSQKKQKTAVVAGIAAVALVALGGAAVFAMHSGGSSGSTAAGGSHDVVKSAGPAQETPAVPAQAVAPSVAPSNTIAPRPSAAPPAVSVGLAPLPAISATVPPTPTKPPQTVPPPHPSALPKQLGDLKLN